MSRPIPVDIVPSHAYLSEADQTTLFGSGYAMTVGGSLTQGGQHFYQETVEVFGRLKRSFHVHVLGPHWEHSFVELTPTEAEYLGLHLQEVRSGNLTLASSCRLKGSAGEIEAKAIIARPHLRCSPQDAESLNIQNGQEVQVALVGRSHVIVDVLVRVHPTFSLHVDLRADHAREFWITRPTHAHLVV